MCDSLNVGLHAQPPEISEQQFDEEVGLLWVSHPQDAAAVPCDGVIPARCESVTNMQGLHADTHSYTVCARLLCAAKMSNAMAALLRWHTETLRGSFERKKALHLQTVWLLGQKKRFLHSHGVWQCSYHCFWYSSTSIFINKILSSTPARAQTDHCGFIATPDNFRATTSLCSSVCIQNPTFKLCRDQRVLYLSRLAAQVLHESFQSKGFIAHLPTNPPKFKDSAAGSGPYLSTSTGQPTARISLQALSLHAADHMTAQSVEMGKHARLRQQRHQLRR